jgi:protein TonB
VNSSLVAASPTPAETTPPVSAPVAIPVDYQQALSAWIEAHKVYPEAARQAGEQGRAVLRFRIDRTGRVLNYTVIGSTGHADLDAAVETMMRGAVLPPFPPSISESQVEVTVAVRFGLIHPE